VEGKRGESKLEITSLNSHFTPQEPQHKVLRRKKAEPRTPHFLSLNQDIVARSQTGKWGLKYDTHTLGKVGRSLDTNDRTICRELKLDDIKSIQSSN